MIGPVEIDKPLSLVTLTDGIDFAEQDVMRTTIGLTDDATIERDKSIFQHRSAGREFRPCGRSKAFGNRGLAAEKPRQILMCFR